MGSILGSRIKVVRPVIFFEKGFIVVGGRGSRSGREKGHGRGSQGPTKNGPTKKGPGKNRQVNKGPVKKSQGLTGATQGAGSSRSSIRNKPSGSKSSSFRKNRNGSRWVVGLHACREVIAVRPHSITKILAKKGSEGETLVRECKGLDIDVRWVEDHELAKLARTHQGIAMEVDSAPEVDWKTVFTKPHSIVLILDEIVDPHNLGAIMRTAWLMGCEAVVTSQNRSAGLTPAVAKVACGAIEHVPLVIESQLPAIMQRLKENGFWISGLAFSATNHLWQQDLKGKVCWVVGSEEKGIRKPVEKECDTLVSIPQHAASASYNASVATAIAIAETCRQQRQ